MIRRLPRSLVSIAFYFLSLSAIVISSFSARSRALDLNMVDFQNSSATSTAKGIKVAHIGNSIQYYNDCPRLLERMFKAYYGPDGPENNINNVVVQDSCLRGGASLVSLPTKGNGMATKFATPNALRPDGTYDIGSPTVQDLLTSNSWDFVIMNDHTQSPARLDSRKNTLKALETVYLPLLQTLDPPNPVVVFLMTAAYRKPVKDADELGSFDEFTEKLQEGYSQYQQMIPNSKVAPVGLAYQYVRNNYPKVDTDGDDSSIFSWEWLYARDDFHPSPHGTLLEAFVLFATIVGEEPPTYDPSWWDTARYMQPPDVEPLPLPTPEEAALLQGVACAICNVGGNLTCVEDERVNWRAGG